MPLLRLILDVLGVPPHSLKDLLLNLSRLELCVSLISFCIFLIRCIYCVCIRPPPANCGKIGFKYKQPLGLFTLKTGLFPSPWKLKLGLSVFILTFKLTFDFKDWRKIQKCKVKISLGNFKWTLAHKGKGMVSYNCDNLPNKNHSPREGKTS